MLTHSHWILGLGVAQPVKQATLAATFCHPPTLPRAKVSEVPHSKHLYNTSLDSIFYMPGQRPSVGPGIHKLDRRGRNSFRT